MKFDFDIPKELAHLKLDERGYPIPYFARITDGKPNFRFQDDGKREIAVKRRLCGICGRKLPKDYCYNITGPQGLKNRVASDAFMHRVCAEFAMRVCPHIYFEKAERKEDTMPYMTGDKPAEIYLVKVSSWKGFMEEIPRSVGSQDTMNVRLLRYTPVSWEKYVYVDNVLVRDPGP